MDTELREWQTSTEQCKTVEAAEYRCPGGKSDVTLDPQSIEWQKFVESDRSFIWSYLRAGRGYVLLGNSASEAAWFPTMDSPVSPDRVYFVPLMPKPVEHPEVLRKNLHDMLDMAIERSAAGDHDEAVRLLDGLASKLGSEQ